MKEKIIAIGFFIFILGFFIINLITVDLEVSVSERRYLNKLDFSIENLVNGEIFEDFDDYAMDHFAFRDKFRKVKAMTELNFFKKNDYNDLYVKNDYIYKIEYPLNENSVLDFTRKLNDINLKYLTNNKVYYSIIPDKNYYSKDKYLKMDYDKLIDIFNDNIDDSFKYIDITDKLELSDYYYTDIHWRQDKLDLVVNELAYSMDFRVGTNYRKKKYNPFYGSYYGQLGIGGKTDELVYLTNKTIEKARVKDLESDLDKVYDEEALGGIDSYDVYLGGASSIVEVYNNNSSSSKELIIFRDSFGSSMAPLLLDGYSKITLIDLRYISASLLSEYVEFNNQDVLFLYNTTIINNSRLIKE